MMHSANTQLEAIVIGLSFNETGKLEYVSYGAIPLQTRYNLPSRASHVLQPYKQPSSQNLDNIDQWNHEAQGSGLEDAIEGAIYSQGKYSSSARSREDKAKYEGEADSFRSIVDSYVSGRGKTLVDYLNHTGHDMTPVKGVGSMKLDDSAVAALVTYERDGKAESLLVSNGSGKGFNSRVKDFADRFVLSEESASEYILVHEFMHAAGYHEESDCERAAGQYFMYMAENSEGNEQERYLSLARTADLRAKLQDGSVYYPKEDMISKSRAYTDDYGSDTYGKVAAIDADLDTYVADHALRKHPEADYTQCGCKDCYQA